MPMVKLTQQFINKELICPPGKSRIEYGSDNFYIEVRATSQGQGTYYLRYKDSTGKTCHQKIGRTADTTLGDAYKKCALLKAEIALGADPRGEESARRAVLTFSEFFEEHYLPYVKPRKRSWDRDEQLYRLRIKAIFGNKRLNQITRQQIQSFHTSLMNEPLAASTCNHHIKLMKHAFNLAIDWDMVETNPVSRVPLFLEDNKIEHYMNDAQLEELLKVLYFDKSRPVCMIAIFLLSTGCRLLEILSAKWSDVDLNRGIFTVRAINSKSKRLRSVPLNESALDVLHQLDTQGKYEFLFINQRTGKPYVNVAKVWTRVRKEAGLPNLRLHDLRHQYASFLVNSGRTLYEVQQILGHSDPKVTMRYAHLSTKALQDAANCTSTMIKEATRNAP